MVVITFIGLKTKTKKRKGLMGLDVESESYFCFLISGCFFFDYNMRGICRRQD